MRFFSLLIVCFTLSAKEYRYDVAICAIFQDEAPYLREWIEFHKLVGVKHFYLYNNLSSDNYLRVLLPYIRTGEVELIPWCYKTSGDGGNWPTIQVTAYNHAINLSKDQAKWLAILDTDEFLFPVEVDNLSEFLTDFEGVGAVSVNWQMYGTSGVKQVFPGHLMIEDLIYKAPADYGENVHVKSVVRPECVIESVNPHCCNLLPGFYQVNSDKQEVFGSFSEVKIDKIRINHYWTRDERFFYEKKLARRKKWGDTASIERANLLNSEVDTAILKYVPRLKKQLQKFG